MMYRYSLASFLMVLGILYIGISMLGARAQEMRTTSWAHRDFKVSCYAGTRLTGHTLEVIYKVQSKSRCLTRCFAQPECQSISYFSKMKECHLSSSSKKTSLVNMAEDENYVYCGPEDNEKWERTAQKEELPDVDDCTSNSCMNGATCVDGVYSYTCTCVAGYTGDTCATDIDDCTPDPCWNGATCVDGVDSFTCTCVAGYIGNTCATDIDDCTPDPCGNGATCVDGVDSFTCTCVPGYMGDTCATSIYQLIRLVNGAGPYEGRVEVYHDGQWGTVCDDNWDMTDANVACHQLGYPYASQVWSSAYFGRGTGPIHLDGIACVGSESGLRYCPHSGWGVHNCGHSEDASVKCFFIINNNIRLVAGGLRPNKGRVEVLYNGQWGTVCDDGWDLTDGNVACKQLGYPSAAETLKFAYYGEGEGLIHLDDVQCTGVETILWECTHSGWGNHNCVHSEDSSVRCNLT